MMATDLNLDFKRIQCKSCDYRSTHPTVLMMHQAQQHDTQRLYSCRACNLIFEWKEHATVHIIQVHYRAELFPEKITFSDLSIAPCNLSPRRCNAQMTPPPSASSPAANRIDTLPRPNLPPEKSPPPPLVRSPAPPAITARLGESALMETPKSRRGCKRKAADSPRRTTDSPSFRFSEDGSPRLRTGPRRLTMDYLRQGGSPLVRSSPVVDSPRRVQAPTGPRLIPNRRLSPPSGSGGTCVGTPSPKRPRCGSPVPSGSGGPSVGSPSRPTPGFSIFGVTRGNPEAAGKLDPFKCVWCGDCHEGFLSQERLVEHTLREHGEKVAEYEREQKLILEKKKKKQDAMNRLVGRQEEEGETPHLCYKCPGAFTSSMSLMGHIGEEHPEPRSRCILAKCACLECKGADCIKVGCKCAAKAKAKAKGKKPRKVKAIPGTPRATRSSKASAAQRALEKNEKRAAERKKAAEKCKECGSVMGSVPCLLKHQKGKKKRAAAVAAAAANGSLETNNGSSD